MIFIASPTSKIIQEKLYINDSLFFLNTPINNKNRIDNDKNISVDIKKRFIIDFVSCSYLVYHYIHLKSSRLIQNMYLKMDQDRSQKK